MLELQRAQVQTSHEIRSNIFFLWNWEGGGMEIQFIWNQMFWKTLSFLSFYKIYLYIFYKYMLTRIDPGKSNIVFFLFFGNCFKKKRISGKFELPGKESKTGSRTAVFSYLAVAIMLRTAINAKPQTRFFAPYWICSKTKRILSLRARTFAGVCVFFARMGLFFADDAY